MAVDRGLVLRQQQLLDNATRQAQGNPLVAERLTRSALMQSGLEYMRQKHAEALAKGGREAELALRKGGLAMRMKDESQRLAMAKEAFAEGQKIRNIGLALNVASTLGAQAIPVIAKGLQADKSKASSLAENLRSKEGRLRKEGEIERAEGLGSVASNLEILERGTKGLGLQSYSQGDALRGARSGGVQPVSPAGGPPALRGLSESETISADVSLPRQSDSIDAYNEQAAQLDDALDVISDQRGEGTMKMIKGILDQSPQASVLKEGEPDPIDTMIMNIVNQNMGVA